MRRLSRIIVEEEHRSLLQARDVSSRSVMAPMSHPSPADSSNVLNEDAEVKQLLVPEIIDNRGLWAL